LFLEKVSKILTKNDMLGWKVAKSKSPAGTNISMAVLDAAMQNFRLPLAE
jgi:hypothetical protein